MSKLDKFEEYVIAPGETISELLEVNCMTQLDLANKTGINKKVFLFITVFISRTIPVFIFVINIILYKSIKK